MTVIEIAIYAAVMSGASPLVCHLQDSAVTRCSNGLVAEALSATTVRYGNGIVVEHQGDRFPVFSNGMRSWLSSAGWLQFGNGIGVRRIGDGNYVFSNGLHCVSELPDLVNCVGPAPKT